MDELIKAQTLVDDKMNKKIQNKIDNLSRVYLPKNISKRSILEKRSP
jgi:hypothetical protein